jgi:peptidoglycan/xylan/chitin deacetylase (PgdA/CDA1 family)
MKTHGDPGWETLPSYLDLVVPRFLEVMAKLGTRITVFVVGQDAEVEANHRALRSIADAGHEIGNHSFHHEPWMHRYSEADQVTELARAEAAIETATGRQPIGFRGPGYALSETTLRVLMQRGYLYDCSTFPSVLGPLARAYYFATAKLDDEQRDERATLFGSWTEGLRPNRPYHWNLDGRTLLEIPVTTMPFAKVPVHLSYVLYLAKFSPGAARAYFAAAVRMCRATGVGLSLLLHPLDFLGAGDVDELAFFPAMQVPTERKLAQVSQALELMCQSFDVGPMERHARHLLERDRRRTSSWASRRSSSRTARRSGTRSASIICRSPTRRTGRISMTTSRASHASARWSPRSASRARSSPSPRWPTRATSAPRSNTAGFTRSPRAGARVPTGSARRSTRSSPAMSHASSGRCHGPA